MFSLLCIAIIKKNLFIKFISLNDFKLIMTKKTSFVEFVVNFDSIMINFSSRFHICFKCDIQFSLISRFLIHAQKIIIKFTYAIIARRFLCQIINYICMYVCFILNLIKRQNNVLSKKKKITSICQFHVLFFRLYLN